MHSLPDDPIIHNLEVTGYPDGKEPPTPICPVCEEDCNYIFKDFHGEIVGCENCIDQIPASEFEECFDY